MSTAPPAARTAVDAGIAATLAAVCCGLYVTTLTPELCFPVTDSHELTLNALRLGVPHPSGYPFYTWLAYAFAHLVPFGEAAHRINLMSATLGAAGIGVLYLVARRMEIGALAASFAVMLLGVSTTFWSQAVITEVYATDVCLIAVTLLMLLRWASLTRAGVTGGLVWFAIPFGLSLGTHLSNLSSALAYTVFVLATDPAIVRRPRELLIAFAGFALGVAQYLWLPLRGGLFEQYPNLPPTTWEGFYAYTLGAFQTMRFAFPLSVLPLRIAFVVRLLVANLGMVGLGLGAFGMWVVLWRHPARFWLLLGLYLTNVVLFSQFAAPDLDVFFLAGYVPWVLFIGFGVQAVLDALRVVVAPRVPALELVGRGLLAVGLGVMLVLTASASHHENDRSRDTLIPDFDRNLYDLLPTDSFVVAARGAFGANLLYWQTALGVRPDVTVLGQGETPRPSPESPLFTTVRLVDHVPVPPGIGGPAPGDLPPAAWYVPVLFGNAQALTLTRVQRQPPRLFVEASGTAPRLQQKLGPLTLVAARTALQRSAPRPRVHVESWWLVPTPTRFIVGTGVDQTVLEMHSLGLGNLQRYGAEVIADTAGLLHEEYDVVLPSTLPKGAHAITLGAVEIGEHQIRTRFTEVARVVLE